MCRTAEGICILKNTRVNYSMPHVCKIMKEWGYTMKVPVGRHINRAGNRRIRRFQKKVKGLESIMAEGRVMCVRDETAVMADVRLRKGACTLKKSGPSTGTPETTPRPCSSAPDCGRQGTL